MSLTGALNSAASGLRTSQELARVSSENVANAMTPGYVRRTATVISGNAATGGAMVGDIRRDVDASLQRLSRMEGSRMARHQAIQEGLNSYTIHIGQPGDGNSPADRFTAFETSLTTLANMPSSNEAQSGAVLAAEDLASAIRGASDQLALTLSEVDMEIRYEVADLNQSLYELRELNRRIQGVPPGSAEAARFDDTMDQLIDGISTIVDTRVTKSPSGVVSVYTVGGAALIEGQFVQDVTFNAGDGTLMAGSQDITPLKDGVRGVQQGSLAGLSELKRDIIPRFGAQLDDYARGLITAFEMADQSLMPGQPGLFTDNGSAYDVANLAGLAGRIQVNESVSYAGDAEVWRMRDGLGATAPGDAADANQVDGFVAAIDQPLGASPASGLPAFVSVKDFAAEMITSQSTARFRAENDFKAAASAAEVVNAARRNSEGVSIDDEMQRLMLIEQSYAANSRMLSTISEMIDTLMAAV